jgi:hypothetical protein
MPPQQSERLLDLVYEALDFGAHGSGSVCRLHLATKVGRRNYATMLEAGGQPTKIEKWAVNPVNSVSVKVLVAILTAGVLGFDFADAATTSETLTTFGFFGTWAMNCHEPASPSNNLRSAFISTTGDAMFNESLGPDSEANVYVILKATRRGDGTIVLRTKLNGETVQELTMRMDGDRLRTLSNRDIARGKYIVRNGRVVSNRHNTPWLTHCTGVP